MPLMLLAWFAPAYAARLYWTVPPTDVERAALERTVPGVSGAPLAERIPAAPPVAPNAVLASELAACGPLFEVFDGELQIMARLQKALADVRVVATDADRALVRSALLTEGYAVRRYFQDRLAIEPDAAPYRTGAGGRAVVAPWAQAAALYQAAALSPADLPDADARLAFDATQAWVRVQPSASVTFGHLAAGAQAWVDGVHVDAAPGARVALAPGRHYVHVAVGDAVVWSFSGEVASEQSIAVEAAYGPSEAAALSAQLGTGRVGWAVPGGPSDEPTYVAVTGGPKLHLVRIDGPVALAVPIVPDAGGAASPGGAGGFGGYLAAGAGWVSSGDFYTLNAGAPRTVGTVNAGAPALAAGAYWRTGLFEAGVGLDALIATGAYHALPSGSADTRAFVHPYAAVGLPWVQITAGPEFPWYVGVGARAAVPLAGPVGLYGRFVYGVGVPIDRAQAEPFEPAPALSAYGGLTVDLGALRAAGAR